MSRTDRVDADQVAEAAREKHAGQRHDERVEPQPHDQKPVDEADRSAHDENRGFVWSANEGMTLHADRGAPMRSKHVSDMGFPKIGYQTFKLLAYQRLHEMASHWKERYPGVDIVLIEPDPDDELMFQTNILNYSSRVEVAKHGFESVTVKLARDYQRYKEVAARHGIARSGDLIAITAGLPNQELGTNLFEVHRVP